MFENTNFAQYPRLVAVRFDPEGCFVSREWTEALARLDTLPDHTAGQAHHQLEDVERTIQTLKRSAEKLHEIHPSLSAEQVVSRVTSIHNALD